MAIESRSSHLAATAAIPKHVMGRKRRFRIDLPVDCFPAAFVSFNDAAEAFLTSLSDPLDRKFGSRYLTYVQGIAQGSDDLPKPYSAGRLSCILICRELERLFRSHFSTPVE